MFPLDADPAFAGLSSPAMRWASQPRLLASYPRHAQTAKLSAEAGRLIATNSANTFADGMAVRVPVSDALDIYSKGAESIITVSDGEIAEAIRLYYRLTHNLTEVAGAAPLAGALQEKHLHQGCKIGAILCSGNIDIEWFQTILSGGTPQV